MLAKLWAPGTPVVSSSDPIFFRLSDQALALAAISASGHEPPAYAVSPNGVALLDFLGPHVLVNWGRDLRGILAADYSGSVAPVSEILRLCDDISKGLHVHAADLVVDSCNNLSSLVAAAPVHVQARIPAKLVDVAAFLGEFALTCMRPLEYGSPLVHASCVDAHKNWWRDPADHLQALAAIKTRLVLDFTGLPSALTSVRHWITDMETRIKVLHATPNQAAQRRLSIREASAFCGAIAERHLMRGHQGLSVLMLHRAVDLLLLALCDEKSIIDYTFPGGRYVHSYAPKVNRITLTNSFDAIKQFLAADPSREPALVRLNDWRNLLMQTHYMSGLGDADARAVFAQVRPHLEALGGADWRDAQKVYIGGMSVSIAELLDSDGSLTAATSPISY